MRKYVAILLFYILASIVTAKAQTCYVLVRDELNVRGKPSLGSEIHGRLFTGDVVEVTRKYKGWCFLEGLASEEGCGWVSAEYLVSEPVKECYAEPAIVVADGRVAARKSIDGERRSWLQPGEVVYVYGQSDLWSVTDRGYVRTEYLKIQ